MVQIITLLKIPWESTSLLDSWWNMENFKTLLPEEGPSSTWRVVIHHFIVLRRASLFTRTFLTLQISQECTNCKCAYYLNSNLCLHGV